MITFAEIFPDLEIVSALRTQFHWTAEIEVQPSKPGP